MFDPLLDAYIATMQRFNPVHPWFQPLPGVDHHKLWAAIKQNPDKAETFNIDELLGIKLNHYKMEESKMNSSTPALPEKTTGLDFTEAMSALADGHKVRLPEWTGYWFQQGKDIKVFSRTGDILDTPNWKHYGMREDWSIVTEGMGFDFAMLAVKAGKAVRCGTWNWGTFMKLQVPDANSKMSMPYLYVQGSLGRCPYSPDNVDIMQNNWEIYVEPTPAQNGANLSPGNSGAAVAGEDVSTKEQKSE